MKKLLAVVLAAMMMFTLASCGGETVTLANRTVAGLSMDVPSDFSEFAEQGGNQMAAVEDANIIVTPKADAGGATPDLFDEATFRATTGLSDSAEFVQFDNAGTCAGVPAVRADIKDKNENGVNTMTYSCLLFLTDGTFQTVVLSCNADADSFAQQNSEAILSSIKLA